MVRAAWQRACEEAQDTVATMKAELAEWHANLHHYSRQQLESEVYRLRRRDRQWSKLARERKVLEDFLAHNRLAPRLYRQSIWWTAAMTASLVVFFVTGKIIVSPEWAVGGLLFARPLQNECVFYRVLIA